MASVRQYLLLQCFLFPALISLLFLTAPVASTFPTSLPGCPDKCGNVTIPYPFGTRHGCYREGFTIACNESFNPPKPFLFDSHSEIELLDINIGSSEVRVLNYIGYDCYNKTGNVNSSNPYIGIQETPFLFSNRRNKFTVIGCDALAYIAGQANSSTSNYTSGCVSFCDNLNHTTGNGSSCDGLGCCQTSIPEGLNYYEVQWGYNNNTAWSFNPCSYAALMQEDWYTFNISDLGVGFGFIERNKEYAPIVLEWAIRENNTACLASHVESNHNPACKSMHSRCNSTTNGEGYICECLQGYEGNPYLLNGCIDIDECTFPDNYPCEGECQNSEGSYECRCPAGKRGDAINGNCVDIFPMAARVAVVSIAAAGVLVGLFFLVATYRQHKKYEERKKEFDEYYLMMGDQLRRFSRNQIEIATDYYNETHVVGRGGQGNVYKGFLENKQVAIKKAKEVEATGRRDFVNEIILLAQINHKNIVRLLGCCLEVEIPMLVYDLFPNGSVFDLLHRRRSPISLGTRLKIALGSAIALDYLHSYTFQPIIHGDVKSANILLDADYTAKVSDFGASSVVPVNEIVELVHYSPGYLDPECIYTQILTTNSDVYSFGVVMLELVTRKKSIFVDENRENQVLATCFLSKAKKNEQRQMLDVEIVANDENVGVVLDEICEIAVQCLSPKGEDRPTMRHVAEELQKLVRLYDRSASRKLDEEEMESLLGDSKLSSMSDASGFRTTQYSAVLQIDAGAPR